jgi:dTDP-4-amino-4,6-dideoxygalactose transaminase
MMNTPVIPYLFFERMHRDIGSSLEAVALNVIRSGQSILGSECVALERELGKEIGAHVITVGNGTDALMLSLRDAGIGQGDEVITAPNSFIASAASIALLGARPVFVDVRDDYLLDPQQVIEACTSRTKAILPVHLTGSPAELDMLVPFAQERGLCIIEDAAQAIGATYAGCPVGSFGTYGCFSLHPLKNLGVAGDGGFITTKDDAVAHRLRLLRNHGLQTRDEAPCWGYNSRLDELQASLARVKLPHLAGWTTRRRAIATHYRTELAGVITLPPLSKKTNPAYHTFIIQTEKRDALREHLSQQGIETKIHYPLPLHLQEAARGLGYKRGDFPVAEQQAQRILSLPVHQYLTDAEVEKVIRDVRSFYH